jgi:hypothetical protein
LEAPLAITLNSFIKKYSPLASDTSCIIESAGIKFEFIKSLLNTGLYPFVDNVYYDRKKGYEDIKFLNTDIGAFINSNDHLINISIPKIYLGKAVLTNVSFSSVLKKGLLRGELLSAEGFGAKYSASLEGFLNSDFPRISFKGSLDNFDLGSFSMSGGISGINSGMLSASFKYDMNGNRLAHFIDNGLLESSLTLIDLNINKSDVISNFENYFKDKGYNFSFLPISIQSGKIEYRQTGENGSFTIMSLVSDKVRMEGYGRYTYLEGINALGSLNFISKEVQTQSVIPYKITGALKAPVFKIDIKGKSSDGFVLY